MYVSLEESQMSAYLTGKHAPVPKENRVRASYPLRGFRGKILEN